MTIRTGAETLSTVIKSDPAVEDDQPENEPGGD